MQALLEAVQRGLAKDGGENVFNLSGEQRQPLAWGGGVLDEDAESKHLPKNTGGFGRRQRGMVLQEVLFGGEEIVQAVPELMREGHHVTLAFQVIGQYVWMPVGGEPHAERAAAFAGAHRGVNPALLEKPRDHASDIRVELGVGALHDGACLFPGYRGVIAQ
ncbi:MAG: hypothetical protein BWY76_02850 [bacterium ADurb.Bin429]|nr:MAG: hypothetical protein BWY76_02850 [bacterium ADurb.Bin429]